MDFLDVIDSCHFSVVTEITVMRMNAPQYLSGIVVIGLDALLVVTAMSMGALLVVTELAVTGVDAFFGCAGGCCGVNRHTL